jgi:hypothetical protein
MKGKHEQTRLAAKNTRHPSFLVLNFALGIVELKCLWTPTATR